MLQQRTCRDINCRPGYAFTYDLVPSVYDTASEFNDNEAAVLFGSNDKTKTKGFEITLGPLTNDTADSIAHVKSAVNLKCKLYTIEKDKKTHKITQFEEPRSLSLRHSSGKMSLLQYYIHYVMFTDYQIMCI